ncbi:MAG: phospholipid carrier-dependent glycosyltransferase [Candidatus Taylorbacteria bacterium]
MQNTRIESGGNIFYPTHIIALKQKMRNLKEHAQIIALSIGSIISHFIFFSYPSETVFDEVHFGKFISGYFSHQYFFDIHPPLAKLFITGVGLLGGYKPEIDFSVIGESFTSTDFIWLRLLPTLAGAILPLVIYYLSRALNFSKTASFAAGALIIFENSLLVQSRFILLDSLLLLFGFGSLLFYFLYRKKEGTGVVPYLFLGAIVFSSFAFSIKWTGLSFLALIVALECARLFHAKSSLKKWLLTLGSVFGLAFVIYFSTFAVHFALLSKNGPGKDFMSPEFQKTLEGNSYQNDETIHALPMSKKFVELNLEMYRANKRLDATHPYGSAWYTWPFMERPIYFWKHEQIEAPAGAQDGQSKVANIYSLGNPFIYWLGSASVLFLLLNFLSQAVSKNKDFRKKSALAVFLLSGFFLNFLPFIFIGRVMFLYHYCVALIFSILILCFLLDGIQLEKKKKAYAFALILISLSLFLYFSPLTYGIPLRESAENARFWFKSWR